MGIYLFQCYTVSVRKGTKDIFLIKSCTCIMHGKQGDRWTFNMSTNMNSILRETVFVLGSIFCTSPYRFPHVKLNSPNCECAEGCCF